MKREFALWNWVGVILIVSAFFNFYLKQSINLIFTWYKDKLTFTLCVMSVAFVFFKAGLENERLLKKLTEREKIKKTVNYQLFEWIYGLMGAYIGEKGISKDVVASAILLRMAQHNGNVAFDNQKYQNISKIEELSTLDILIDDWVNGFREGNGGIYIGRDEEFYTFSYLLVKFCVEDNKIEENIID